MGRKISYILAAALSTLLLFLAIGPLGPAGILVCFLIPFPAIYAHLLMGPAVGATVVVLSGLGAYAGAGGISSLGYLLQFGLASFLLPYLLRRRVAWDRAVAATLGVAVAAGAVSLVVYASGIDLTPGQAIGNYIDAEVQRALTVYREAGVSVDELNHLEDLTQAMADFLSRAYYGLAAVVTGVMFLVTLVLIKVVGKDRVSFPGASFHRWKLPEWLIWALILAGFGTLWAEGAFETLALNLLTVLVPVYFLQGLAIVTYFFRTRGISKAVQVLGYAMVLLMNPLPLLVTGLGVFDLWVDFRKPRIKKA